MCTRDTTPDVAFVLSGGASLGAIQVGMLRALYERGVTPDVIVGTSAGAVNGAFIASRPQVPATADALARIWRDLRRGQVFPLNPLTGLLGFLGNRDHLVSDSGLRRVISRHVAHRGLEDMPIPLHVVAVDVISGEEVRLSRGPVLDAVLASASIPAVLPPVSWGDRTLMDGGVANETPISHAVELGAPADLRPADGTRVHPGRGARRGAGHGVARHQPAHPAPPDRRHRASSRRRPPDRPASAVPLASSPSTSPRRGPDRPRARRRS